MHSSVPLAPRATRRAWRYHAKMHAVSKADWTRKSVLEEMLKCIPRRPWHHALLGEPGAIAC